LKSTKLKTTNTSSKQIKIADENPEKDTIADAKSEADKIKSKIPRETTKIAAVRKTIKSSKNAIRIKAVSVNDETDDVKIGNKIKIAKSKLDDGEEHPTEGDKSVTDIKNANKTEKEKIDASTTVENHANRKKFSSRRSVAVVHSDKVTENSEEETSKKESSVIAEIHAKSKELKTENKRVKNKIRKSSVNKDNAHDGNFHARARGVGEDPVTTRCDTRDGSFHARARGVG